MNRVLATGLTACLLALGAASAQGNYTLPGALGFEYQRLNNCGPVTAKMALSLSGIAVTQTAAAGALKGSYLDRNVSTPELASYLQARGLLTVRRWSATPALVRRLVRAGFPVILHQQQTATSDIGHFRVAYGFDPGGLVFGDSMFGPRLRLSDRQFEAVARPFNGEYLVAYRAPQAAALRAVLGADWDKQRNLERLEARSRARINVVTGDAYAWWGLGQSLLYRDSARAAAPAFTKANRLGLPAKFYWYQHDALDAWNRAGEYAQTVRVAAAALNGYPNSTELNTDYARALERQSRFKAALGAWRAALVEDPRSGEARAAVARLSQKVETL
jgi:hypothetical protein